MTPDDGQVLTLSMSSNRSLSPRGVTWLAVGFSACLLLTGLRFLVLGAWPVALFCALDAALFVVLLRSFQRQPPDAEELQITREAVRLSTYRRGKTTRIELPGGWTRLDQTQHEVTGLSLALVSRNRRHPVAACLSPPEREEIAPIIQEALRRNR